MPKPIAVQLYSVREQAKQDLPGVLREVSKTGFAGVEFAGMHGNSPSDIAKIMRDEGLKACGAHAGMPGKENIKQLADDARTLGYTYLIAGFGPDAMATEDGAKQCGDQLEEGAQIARSAGLSLCMHNHWWEFEKSFGGKTAFEIIMSRAPKAFSELDIYWCNKAGKDSTAEVRRWKGRIPLMHVKDGDLGPTESPHKALGEGKIPLKQILSAASEDPEVKWFVVELDSCATDMMTAVKNSFKWLSSSKLGEGKTR